MDEQELYNRAVGEGLCPRCGSATRQIEKDTSSGREIREFGCTKCDWSHIFDCGPALWKLMSGDPD
jgi:hypothetical protein